MRLLTLRIIFLVQINQKTTKPIFIAPIPVDEAIKNVPTSDYSTNIPFSDNPNIKTPHDVSPPLVSPTGDAFFDIPNFSPDGIFSPDPTVPGNYVPDIPADFPTDTTTTINNPDPNNPSASNLSLIHILRNN
jgi:hypothetical protein